MNVASTDPMPTTNFASLGAKEVSRYIDAKPNARNRLYQVLKRATESLSSNSNLGAKATLPQKLKIPS